MKISRYTKKILSFGIAFLMFTMIYSKDILADTSGKSTFTNKSLEYGDKITFEGLMGPDHGLIESIVFHPETEGEVYASNTLGRQIFKSTDFGQTWHHFFSAPGVDDSYLNPIIRNLRFVNPAEPSHLYFTINLNDAWEDIESRGLYVINTEFGELIDTIQIFEQEHLCIHDYDVDKTNPDNIVLYSKMGWDYPGSRETVWKTNDKGLTFELIYDFEDYSNHTPSCVKFHPENSDMIYMGMRSSWSGTSGGINISVDGGETWATYEEGIAISDIAFIPGEPDKIYVVSGDGADNRVILFSEDAGLTWSEVDLGIELVAGWMDYYTKIAINPTNPNYIWVLHSENILVSTDGGETWESTYFDFDDFLYVDGISIAINPFNNEHAIISSLFSPIQTTNMGTSWEKVGNTFTAVESLYATNFGDGSTYLYYTTPGSYYIHNLTNDEVSGEEDLSGWGDTKFLTGDKYTQNRVFSGQGAGFIGGISIRMSDDNMETSNEVISHNASALKQIIRSPENANIYWLVLPEYDIEGNTYLVRTIDGFATHENITVTGVNEIIHKLAVAEGQAGVLWAAVESPMFTGALKSTNNGTSWVPHTTGIPANTVVYDIAIDQNNPENMALCTAEGIFISNDGGSNWNSTIIGNACKHIIFSKANPGVIIALDNIELTLLYSIDGGEVWFVIPEEISIDADYNGMDIIDNVGIIDIYLPTNGAGILKYSLSLIETYSLTFYVKSESGEEISNAVITINGTEYEEGVYSFNELLPDTYNYTVTKGGYNDVSGSVTITDDNKEVIVTMEEAENVTTPVIDYSGIVVYPIPAYTNLNVKSANTINEIVLINILGQTVYSEIIDSNEFQINISKLKMGVYFLKIYTSEGIETRKIQVNR
jgi:photosystem II stability/assembly factor-like uncharacterized protein